MASFGWKRKVGEKVSKTTVQQFEKDSEQADDEDVEKEGVDWLHVIKRRREVLLEDCAAKSKRLKDEGMLLAEQGRNWEALKRWDEAIQLTPDDPVLYEMKSQVLITLQEVFLAVQSAEMATRLRPLWWEAWQTLGRAQLSLGEVELAVRSFQVALHMHPSERPLWEEDLGWALKLREQQKSLREREKQEEEARRLLVEAPELKSDYDFESDEVIEACTAMAERQKQYEELKKTALVVDTHGVTKEVIVEDDSEPTSSSQSVLVKARGL
ncbi:tetratricopeptide repeat protein 33 [Carassius auratus]|uniref:Tetratricopeptide repeat protein 33 n=1 Tax=Carassius auratus TaxID=7957 RepID=A0A6P6K5X8_CARAU|nr:tetratricopeptide repeat protein 33 [Carassius auratus]XP_026067748.1 tetratricopeptide repeat protein 33 [Carassius auratus]XP_026067749.1 tetratricopeptide repeat protein 33 [Carassius auratus]